MKKLINKSIALLLVMMISVTCIFIAPVSALTDEQLIVFNKFQNKDEQTIMPVNFGASGVVSTTLTDALIAEFYIASDMSAVYRVDTDKPILIWGSAQSMLDATIDENNITINDSNEDDKLLEVNYVSIIPQRDAIAIGSNTSIVVTVPGMLKYILSCKLSNPEIVKIDEKGYITAVAEGEAVITGIITIDGAEKSFEFTVSSFNENPVIPNMNTTENSNVLWIVASAIIIIILLTVSVLILKNKNKQDNI